MTAMVEAPSWYVLVSSEVEEHIVIRGLMIGVCYRDEILDVCVIQYGCAIGPILMDDNARPHRARVVEEYLQQKNIVHMDWPA